MPFTVNVLLTCILNCDAGPGAAMIRIVASTVDRFFLCLITGIIFVLLRLSLETP